MSAFSKADVNESISEAARFIARAKAVLVEMAAQDKAGVNQWGGHNLAIDTTKTAAMKRASMDLTRSLARLRKAR